ncbi:MAG TPA: hypothetical protein VH518_10320 [Tepidisphaeraceae bacterium]|jgi:hypothetical protein
MKIDRSHRPWLIFSVVLLVLSGAWYWYDVTRGPDSLNGPSGGSATGITFGIIGSAFMLFAGLFTMRKKIRTWRIGRAEFWMRGHLWLGTLALPMIWLHGGFRHGGTLTTALMWITYAIVLSGIFGAILQHFLPRVMTQQVKDESIYEQIPRVIGHLNTEAEDVVAVCGPENGEELEQWRQRRKAAIEERTDRFLLTSQRCSELVAILSAAPVEGSGPLREFYKSQVKPYLSGTQAAVLEDAGRSGAVFSQQRYLLPPPLHEPLADLQRICDEVRELHTQQRMHRWLHGWLLIHIPLAMALLVLAVVHVIVALRYT